MQPEELHTIASQSRIDQTSAGTAAEYSVIIEEIAAPQSHDSPTQQHRHRCEHNPSAAIYPASMMKLPLAIAAAWVWNKGALQAPFFVTAHHMTTNDAPSPLQTGYAAEFWELIGLMLSQSDNVATNVLLDAVGREAATRSIQDLGATKTLLRRYVSGSLPRLPDPTADGAENQHPASDAAYLLRRLAAQNMPFAKPILTALKSQVWNGKLSAGLKSEDCFAHKTGDTSDVSHDGGILRLSDGRCFVIVVYTTLPSCDETDQRLATFMRLLRPRL